ncbi:MAG: efflux RND transporter periplasmic adaptor subunit [Pirellulaceae bacterium]
MSYGTSRQRPTSRRVTTLWIGLLLLAMSEGFAVRAADRMPEMLVEGFTEPYRTVAVAAAEMGIVEEIHVREGDPVRVGQLLATLDHELHGVQLAIAKTAASAVGRLESSQSELNLRRERLAKLEQLNRQGYAREEEVERARADVEIAEAELLTIREELALRKLELEKAQLQLDRRHVRSKLDGVVTKVHRECGEFVTSNEPVVVTVVQLNPLRLTLSIPRSDAVRMNSGTVLPVRLVAAQQQAMARVEYVSPVTDAESNTVMVRLTIDNEDLRYRAGDRCEMDLRGMDRALAGSSRGPQP